MGSSSATLTNELTIPSRDRMGSLGLGRPAETAIVFFAGVAAGASASVSGFYDLSVWGPISVGVLTLLAGLIVVDRRRFPVKAAVAVAGLAGLWAWSLISHDWSQSPEQTGLASHRWALYAAFLAAFVILVRRGAAVWTALAGVTLGILGVAAYVVIEMLSGDGGHLFIGQRLNSPLGYVNGQGGYFLLGLWPLIAVAERGRPRIIGAVAVGAAALLASLLVLTQSRGIALAFVVAAIVIVAVVPGRQRRLWILLAILAGLVLIGGHLLDVYQEPLARDGLPNDATVRTAARWSLAMALCVGALWGVLDYLAASWARRRPAARRSLRRLSTAGLVGVALGSGGIAVASADWVRNTVSDQYHAFVQLSGQKSSSRFLSGGGHRYDYWRIAVDEFEAHPVRGVGAGGYRPTYFLDRRTDEDITQPHSIELQTLAELGLVGMVFLVAFVVAVLMGLARVSRAAGFDPMSRGVAVAGGGAFVAWLAHTSVDWMHIIPGLTAIALIGAAAFLAGAPGTAVEPPTRRTASRWRWRGGQWEAPEVAGLAMRGAMIAVLVLAAVWVGRLTLGEHYRTLGRDRLASNPIGALRNSTKALAFDDQSSEGHYLQSAALARLNLYRPARAALFVATRREESRNFVTWVLIGDLAVRRGKRTQALSAYRRAAKLNPRDATIKDLASGDLPKLGNE